MLNHDFAKKQSIPRISATGYLKKKRIIYIVFLIVVLITASFITRRQLRDNGVNEWVKSHPGSERISPSTLANPEYFNLVDTLYKEIPELSNSISEFERTGAIRDWAYPRIPMADADSVLDVYDKRLWTGGYEQFTVNVLALRDNNLGGFYCGGISFSLSSIYRLLGYEAYSLDMAVYDDNNSVVSSHVVTLVNIGPSVQDDLKNINLGTWIIQDAMFNITYADEQGAVLSIQKMQELLRGLRYEEIRVLSGKNKWRPYICSNWTLQNYRGSYELDTQNPKILNGRSQVLTHTSFERWGAEFLYEMAPYLKRDGYPEEFSYLYLYPVGCYSPDGSQSAIALRNKLSKLVINGSEK